MLSGPQSGRPSKHERGLANACHNDLAYPVTLLLSVFTRSLRP